MTHATARSIACFRHRRGNSGTIARNTPSTTRKNQNHAAFCCGAFGTAPTVSGASRKSSSILTPLGLRARGFSACSTSKGTMTVRLQYEILSRWNGNHFGSSMISTGITGTARQVTNAERCQHQTGEHVGARCPPARAYRLARASHVRSLDGVADHLEREIGLHARAHVEVPVAEQRPAAVLALTAPEVDRDLGLQCSVDGFRQIVSQQDVFSRNGGVGLELEHPMSVAPLQCEQRVGCRVDAALDLRHRRLLIGGHPGHDFAHLDRPMSSAARLPDRMAPSIVAGKPVLVQSPASTRFRHAVSAPGRLAFSRGVAAKRCSPLAHDLPRRQCRGKPGDRCDFRPQRSR